MSIPVSSFQFGHLSATAPVAAVVNVPTGIETKAVLLNELYTALRFPRYFGANWDALEECVRDLSWLSPGNIVVNHDDLPLANDVTNLKIYLAIMSDAVQKWAGSGDRKLIVAFPSESRARIDWLLRAIARNTEPM
jgi:hypothetical protein